MKDSITRFHVINWAELLELLIFSTCSCNNNFLLLYDNIYIYLHTTNTPLSPRGIDFQDLTFSI